MKKIVLSTHFLRGFSGSEITILLLAQYFKAHNWNVTVACFLKESLLEHAFNEIGISIEVLPSEVLKNQKFDLFWCQHVTTYYALLEDHNITCDKIIFSSLSPFESLETPPISDSLIHLYLANSEETKTALLQLGIDDSKVMVFPNFAIKKDFLLFDTQKHKQLSKVAVISNHFVEEFSALKILLSNKGIQLDHYGAGNVYRLVDAELVSDYDAVITIGRTVQLALAVGTPVFCYDHYAGSGWITAENLAINTINNFSGRGSFTIRRTAEVLLQELISGFDNAFMQRGYLQSKMLEHNCLERNLATVLSRPEQQITTIPSAMPNYQQHERKKVKAVIDLSLHCFALEKKIKEQKAYIDDQEKVISAKERLISHQAQKIQNLQAQLSDPRAYNYLQNAAQDNRTQSLRDKNKEIKALHVQVNALSHELGSVYRSNSWKITKPMRLLSVQLKRTKKLITLVKKGIQQKQGGFNFIRESIRLIHSEGTVRYVNLLRCGFVEIQPMNNELLEGYTDWIERNDTYDVAQQALMRRHIAEMAYKPMISVLMPTYNTPAWALKLAIESVRNQIYPYWELCIADDASTAPHIKEVLQEYATLDARIKVKYRTENGHISRASNTALELVTGDFIALLDHDDELYMIALYEVARAINNHPEATMFYSDEDKLNQQGVRCDPYFKSDWNPDLFLAQNMFNHLGVYKTELIRQVNGFREGVEGSQDYDLILRCIELVGHHTVHHIPKILYHWRMLPGSAAIGAGEKPYTTIAALKAIQAHLDRQQIAATVEEVKPQLGYYRIRYALPVRPPKVSIIIPTRDRKELVQQCIESLLAQTVYINYEILLIDNGSTEREALSYFEALNEHPKITVIRDDQPFNYSALNNHAVKQATGEIICLLNNDIEVISPDWLSEMVSHALRPEIGAVGARLWYPNDRLQHGGVILGIGGIGIHAFHGLTRAESGYFTRAWLTQNYSAVTAACLVIKKSVYEAVGGLDENLPVAFNDVDFCMRVRDAGYRNVWTPFAELYHHESATRGNDQQPDNASRMYKEVSLMVEKHGDALYCDPFYNPNFDLNRPYQLAVTPRIYSR